MLPVLIPETKDFVNLVCASEFANNHNVLVRGGEPVETCIFFVEIEEQHMQLQREGHIYV